MPRGHLRQAIRERADAQRALDEAQRAVAEAESRQYAAARKAEELLEKSNEPRDDVVALCLAGDVASLVRPTAEIDALSQEARGWKRAKNAAMDIVSDRKAALRRANVLVEDEAREVVDETVDAERLIDEAAAARKIVVEKQHEIARLLTILPDGSSKRALLSDFLSQAWLVLQADNPSGAAHVELFERLMNDADAR
ncbi:MAG TPA: hypothetical protein VIF88_11970 [Methylocystis sp.]